MSALAVARAHATGGERHPRKIAARRFARKIASALVRARRRYEFDWLVVIAGPGFLGLLRNAMPPALRALVAAEITKDLVHEPRSVVQWYLPTGAFSVRPTERRRS